MVYHESCSIHACLAGKVDPKAYQTKHSDATFPPSDGNCPRIEPQQELIRDILQRGHIPLLNVSIFNGGVKIAVVEYQAGMKYVAISHLWFHGLGNENYNWLPQCQFVHLVQAINTIQSEATGDEVVMGSSKSTAMTALFWIDTICVPRADEDVMALAQMAATYKESTVVLVLDAELYHTSRRTSVEAIIRLLCSSWMRRLWTLQEGILAGQRLCILFEGEGLDLWKELDKLKAEHKRTLWMCNPMIPFAVRTGIQQSVRATGREKMSWLFSDMNWRSVSRQTDEALVLANMLGLTPKISIKSLPGTG